MQAIYEAILLIPHSPTQATRTLNYLATEKLHFLQQLKDMALQLYDRFQPKNLKQQRQYQTMSKHILVTYNTYVKVSFKQQAQNIYLYIQQLYQWLLAILACKTIAVTAKKVLVPALATVINALSLKTQQFVTFLDWVTAQSMESSSCIFVYLQALLQSNVEFSTKIKIIQQSYNHLYYIALYNLSNVIEFYKNSYMQPDSLQGEEYNLFTNILKGNQYIVNTICQLIDFIYNLSLKKRYTYNRDQLLNFVLLSPQLAVYMSRILNIQSQMFNSRNENLFSLKIIIANNLRKQEKVVINRTKSLCLNMLRLILSLSEKDYNLVHTDKLLMKDLFNLSNLIIEELFICSNDNVVNTLGEEISLDSIISSLYEVEAEIVKFNDIKPTLMEMNVQQIVRVSMGFMKTREEEMRTFESDVQEYFVLVYYILFGSMQDQEEEEEINLSVSEASVKKSVVALIKSLINSAPGYHSILLQICCDCVLLEMQMRDQDIPNPKLQEMFLSKYNLSSSIFECLTLQSCLFVFTVLLSKCSSQFQSKKKLRFILNKIKLNSLNELQLCRLYVCLAVNAPQFRDQDMQLNYYDVVVKVFKIQNVVSSTCRHGYNFLDRLVNCHQQYTTKYSIFIDKILNDAIDIFLAAQSPYLFDFIISALSNPEVLKTVVSLGWTNLCLARLKKKIMLQIEPKYPPYQVISVAIRLYAKVIKVGMDRKQLYSSQPYETFEQEMDEFNKHINSFLSDKLFDKFQQIANQKQLISEQMSLILQFNDFLFEVLVLDVLLTPKPLQLITNYSLIVLNRKEDISDQYDSSVFKLLYQVINKNPFQLTQAHYLLVLSWMKWELQREDVNEIFLNRVCIIVQLFYYYISGNIFYKNQMLQFFSNITQSIEIKLIKYLTDYKDYIELVQNEPDPDRRKINIGKLHLHPSFKEKKRSPITIIRLYNSILMRPDFNPKSVHLIKDIIKYYIMQAMPTYDLAVQIIALKSILEKSRNSGVVEIFKLAIQVLYYNTNHSQLLKQEKNDQYTLKTLTEPLRSPFSFIDPYHELFQLVSDLIEKHRYDTVLIDYNVSLQQAEVDVIEFIKSDSYTKELVHKLSSIRRVNNHPRVIRKIKRNQQTEF